MAFLSKIKQIAPKKEYLQAEVLLDNVDKAYTLGDLVSGSVKLTVFHDVDISGARISLEGK